jgi:hypothetical protein
MSETPAPEQMVIDPEALRSLAAAAGVSLSEERAAALVHQAEPHFAQLRLLDAAASASTEPAGTFHLDCWARTSSE